MLSIGFCAIRHGCVWTIRVMLLVRLTCRAGEAHNAASTGALCTTILPNEIEYAFGTCDENGNKQC